MTFWIPKKREFWQRKPTTPQTLNEGHCLAEGLFLYTLEMEGITTCLKGVALTPGSNISYGAGQEGVYSKGSTYADANSAITMEAPPVTGWSGASCLALYDYTGSASSQWPSLIISATSGGYFGNFNLTANLDAGKTEWRAGNGSARIEGVLSGVVAGDLIFHVGTWDKSTLRSYSAINNGALIIPSSVSQGNNFAGATPDNFLNHGGLGSGRSYTSPVYLRAIWDHKLDQAVVEAMREAPYQVLNARKTWFPLGAAGGAGAALAGDAAGQATAAAEATTGIPIAGAMLSVATSNGVISTGIDLGAAASAISLLDGNIDTEIRVSVAAIIEALAQAGLDAQTLFEAAAAGQADAGGTLSGNGAALSATAQAIADGTATITIAITMQGDALAEALAQAGLTVGGSGLEGDASAVADALAVMLTQINMIGGGSAVVTSLGGIDTILQMQAAAASASNMLGGLNTSITVEAAAFINALAQAGLTTAGGGLEGDAGAVADANGWLKIKVQFDGDAVGVAVAAGNLTTGAIDIPKIDRWTVIAEKRNWAVRDERSWRVCA